MNCRQKAIAAAVVSALSSGCISSAVQNVGYPNSGYDKIFPQENIAEIVKNSVKVDILYTEKKDDEKPIRYMGSCSGTVLCGDEVNYVYTAAHCVIPEGDFGNITRYDGRMVVKGYDTEVIKTDYSLMNDIAILSLPNKKLACYDGKLAKDVELGDVLGGRTFPGGGFRNDEGALLKGHVSSFDGDMVDYLFSQRIWTVFDGHIDFGSSGGGIYVFKDGEIFLASNVQVKYIHNKEGLKGMGPVWQTREFFRDGPPDLRKRLLGY